MFKSEYDGYQEENVDSVALIHLFKRRLVSFRNFNSKNHRICRIKPYLFDVVL